MDLINKSQGFAGATSMVAGSAGNAISAIDAADGEKSVGGTAASTALKFASAGAMLGPWGAAGGAILGGIVGLIQGKKEQKAAEEQQVQQRWNASVSSKPNPAASDLSAAQYGQQTGATSNTYLNNKFGINDGSIMGKMLTMN